MTDTITCPHCGATREKVSLSSRATLVYSGTVDTEICLADLVPETAARKWEQKKVLIDAGTQHPTRTLVSFRLEGDPVELDLGDWYGLELDEPTLVAYCWQCNADVTDQFRALLDERVPLPQEA